VFSHGHFFIFGGETLTNLDGSAHNQTLVYNHTDLYNPTSNTWTKGPSMPEGKHGISAAQTPLGIIIAGGGVTSGRCRSSSAHLLRLESVLVGTDER
jgi:N-acetylneuraminic acid mutarotase